MEFVIPPSIVANECEWTLLDFSGIHQSPTSGAVRTVSRGQRWQARLLWSTRSDDERAALMALSARLRGRANRIWLTDPSYRQRGSFPTGELLNNPTFANGTGWSNYGSTNLKPGNREMQIVSNSTSTQGVYQAVQLDAAVAYCLRGCFLDGAGTSGVWFRNQWSNGGTSFLTGGAALRGMVRTAGVSDAWAAWSVYPLLIYTGAAAGQVAICQYASMARCALVVNPSAAVCFTSCLVDALPASTAGLLLAGDHVEVNGEFKTLTADLNSASDGSGQLMFEPAMRVPIIPDNSPVVIFQPMMRGVLTEDVVQTSRPGPTPMSEFNWTAVEA